MSYHSPLDHLTIAVGIDQHPKVKPGWPAVDLYAPGQAVYAIASGTVAHIYPDDYDGGIAGGSWFKLKIPPAEKGQPLIQAIYAHVVTLDGLDRNVRAGQFLGHVSGQFLHLACNSLDELNKVIDA